MKRVVDGSILVDGERACLSLLPLYKIVDSELGRFRVYSRAGLR